MSDSLIMVDSMYWVENEEKKNVCYYVHAICTYVLENSATVLYWKQCKIFVVLK